MAEVIPVKILEKVSYIKLPLGALQVNCYIVWDNEGNDAFVIDPGAEADLIGHSVARFKLKVKYILNTHGHFDHVGANAEVKKKLPGALVAIHGKDAAMLESAHEHGLVYGVRTPKQPAPDIFLEDGGKLSAGGLTLEVMHTPGHSEGGVCLYDERDGLLFTGDTLFAGSVGRTDFEGGSFKSLVDSIKQRILPLPGNVKVMPGHGPLSTIGAEKKKKPVHTRHGYKVRT